MQFVMNILYIFLFIICLSVLIVVHELGHLSMAKAFNVYCNEFSIGFGPKIFSHKRKRGETYFSLRCIPFGGYVSMYGEGMELEEGQNIPPERSLNGIKKWKRCIILAAGVIMNALLALVIFFTYEVAFPKTFVYSNVVNVTKDPSITELTPAEKAGLKTDDRIAVYETNLSYVYGIDPNAVITYKDTTPEQHVYVVLDGGTILGYNQLSWGNYLHFCIAEGENHEISFDSKKEVFPKNNIEKISFKIGKLNLDEQGQAIEPVDFYEIVLECKMDKEGIYYFEDVGIEFKYEKKYVNSFGDSIKNTFVDFGEASSAIVRGFASMFTTKEGFQSAGGIIAIGYQTTNILTNFGWPEFIKIWGLISVNLAIANLFPFPGLDGWHILVLIVEGVAHKEIPSKVKTILSLVGMAILFLLMFVLLFKDAFTFIF